MASGLLPSVEVHFREAERVLDVLASLGASEEEATREAIVAAAHALLAVAASVIDLSARSC